MSKWNRVLARARGAAAPRAEMQGTQSLVLNGAIMIYGVIDSVIDPWDDGTSIRAIDVMASLAELGDQDKVVVKINSPGGSVFEGLAIYNALTAWPKAIEVHVDAMAASVASVIAMAGDDIVMAENASMMIHDPWTIAMGGADDLRIAADEIDRIKQIMIALYAQRTGLDAPVISAMMATETYMSAADAVEKGFADRVDTPLKIAACEKLQPSDLRRLLSLPTMQARRAAPPALAHARRISEADAVRARLRLHASAP